jgi:hypothetical protein
MAYGVPFSRFPDPNLPQLRNDGNKNIARSE